MPNDLSEQLLAELESNSKSFPSHTLLSLQVADIGMIIDCERFSTRSKLFHVTTLVLKFLHLLRRWTISAELARVDISHAEELWIRKSQQAL